METQYGKALEKFLVGSVNHPIPEAALVRSGIETILIEKGGEAKESDIARLERQARLAGDGDPLRKQIFSAAVRPIRREIEQNVSAAFQAVRDDQDEEASYAPNEKQIFPYTILTDLEDALDEVLYDDQGDQLYRLHIYTAIGSGLDLGKKVDCWVEARDVKTDKPIATLGIDIKTDPNQEHPGGMSDMVYHFHDKYFDDSKRKEEKINPDAFTCDYHKRWVTSAAKSLKGKIAANQTPETARKTPVMRRRAREYDPRSDQYNVA